MPIIKHAVKRTLALALTVLMLLALAPTAFAALPDNPSVDTMGREEYLLNLTGQPFSIPFYRLATGEIAYCLDSSMFYPGGTGYERFIPKDYFEDKIYKGLLLIMHNGYPIVQNTLTPEQAEYATALAVWSWLLGGAENGSAFTLLSMLDTGGNPDNNAILDFAHHLVNLAANSYLGIQVEPTSASLLPVDDHLEGSVRINLYSVNSYTLHEEKLPAGVTVSGYTGSDGDVLTFSVPMSYDNQSISVKDLFSATLNLGNLIHWFAPTVPGVQRIAAMEVGGGSEETYADMALHSGDAIPRGWLEITKCDNTTYSRLAGAVFEMFDAVTDVKVDEFTTDSGGVGRSRKLPFGRYYYIEKTPPTGYRLNVSKNWVTISDSVYPVTEWMYNSRSIAKVKVVKTDEDDDTIKLSSAVFGIYRASDNEKVSEVITGIDGTTTSGDLQSGKYYLQEIIPPPGYVLSTLKYPFELTEHDSVVTVECTNSHAPYQYANVRLIKQDTLNTSVKLEGAVFGVYRVSNNAQVGELTTGADGTAVSGELPLGHYYLKEITPPEGYAVSAGKYLFELDTEGATVDVTVDNVKLPSEVGRVTLVKQDADDSSVKLRGAEFGVYRVSDDALMAELITGSGGTATSHDMPLGQYYLQEISPPTGYAPTTIQYPFELSVNGTTVTVTVTNNKLSSEVGRVRLVKQDAADASIKLPDAVFGIYNLSDDSKLGELTTGVDGTTTSSELPLGSYYLKEITAPTNYMTTTAKYPFALTSDGMLFVMTIENAKLPAEVGQVKLVKQDTDDSSLKLKGAEFGIYRASDDVLVGELTTGSGGTATSPDMPLGQYYLKELTPPTGYAASNTKYPFGLTVSGATVTVTVENVKLASEVGRVRLVKQDADDSSVKLKGAEFGIYRASDDVRVGEITTGSGGTATSSDMPLGSYYLKEITAPTGYAATTTKHPFALTVSGATVTVTVNNAKLPSAVGKVELRKVDSTSGAALQGAVFGVYRASDNVKVGELATGADGTATSGDLPVGSYYLKELTAPAGYTLDGTQRAFTIGTAGEVVKVTVTNVKAPLRLEVVKRDAETGAYLAGAEFSITKTDGTAVTKITSDAGGVARVDLLAGEYVLQETKAPSGYVLNTKKRPFSMASTTAILKIEMTNRRVQGTVKLVKVDENDKPLAGAVFSVYNANGTAVTLITTGNDGTSSASLPAGQYYIVEKTAPTGYKLSTEKHTFTIDADGLTVQVKAKNEKTTPDKQGTLEVFFKHIKDGRELHKSYSYTDAIGTEYMPWVYKNNLNKMPISPYTYVKADYPSSVTLIDGKLVLTYWYDDDPKAGGSGGVGSGGYGGTSGSTSGPGNGSNSTGDEAAYGAIRALPKTGEPFPWGAYVAAGVLLLLGVGTLTFAIVGKRKGFFKQA